MEKENRGDSRKTDSQKLLEKYLEDANKANSYLVNNDQEESEIRQYYRSLDNNTPFFNTNDDAISFEDIIPSEEQKRAFEATSIFEPDYVPEDILDFYYRRSPTSINLSPTSTDSDISNLSLYLVWTRTKETYDPAHLTDEGIYLEDNYLNESSSDEELIEGIRKLNLTSSEEVPPSENAALTNYSHAKRQNDDEDALDLNPIKKNKKD
ncbi:uncharacterized protein LOC112906061 [Agrilus planipennis]|uniref:Uncharacterized protein LOC112906061 n=1 Tax=Agrilus planipennis TaxID=224129 RepID=A0A7F5RHG3_AGRPL|nr:uncharacterized protein LOC112906061 [Agrilus planipennis]